MNHVFPRVYRTGRAGRGFYIGLGAVAVTLSLAGAAFFLYFTDDPPASKGLFGGICGAFALMGVYLIAAAFRTCVTLASDAIEVREMFSTKRMSRDEIAGRRLLPQQYGPPLIRLVPRYTGGKSLTLIPYLKTDAAFEAWFANIPDIDAEEAQASLESMLDDAGLKGSPQEKLAELERARRLAGGIRNATLAVCAWVWFYPHPYDLAVACAALIPWVAVEIAARGGSLYRLNPKPNDVGADLSTPVILPGFALTIRALFDSQVLDWEKMLMMTIVATALCVLLLVWRVRELRESFGLFGLLMVAYAYGVVALANFRLDDSEPTVYAVPVLGAHVSSGKTRSYYLKLGPWGPRTEPEDVDVGSEYYQRGSNRETVCVYLYRGALQMRWFEVWDCPAR